MELLIPLIGWLAGCSGQSVHWHRPLPGAVPACAEVERYQDYTSGFRERVFEIERELSDPGPLCQDGEGVRLPDEKEIIYAD